MEKQLTAVEWYRERLKHRFLNCDTEESIYEQAKEMEKEQIIKARLSLDQSIHFLDALDKSEQYYNETFKNK
jgi:hypothetical protein